MKLKASWVAILWLASAAYGQDVPLFTEDFPPEEFRARREKVYDAMGLNALALIQGAPSPPGYVRFRQTNSFYYLSGASSLLPRTAPRISPRSSPWIWAASRR